jgi:hypothetical protein
MPNKAANPDTLARLEAAANRRRLAATTPQERCLAALALVAIRGYRRQVEGQANSGEGTTAVASSPVGVSRPPAAPPLLDSRPVVAAGRESSLDPMPCPPEIAASTVAPAAETTPARRAGQRA